MQTLAVNASQVATIAIVALGMTLVIASGGIDLSVGSVMAVAGALAPMIFLSAWAVANPGLGLVASIVLPLLAAAACGLFNGVLIAHLGVQPIIATLIFFISGRGIAQVLTNGQPADLHQPGFHLAGDGAHPGPAGAGLDRAGADRGDRAGGAADDLWALPAVGGRQRARRGAGGCAGARG